MTAPRNTPASRLQTAHNYLLAPFDLTHAKLGKVLGTLAAHQVDDADIYFQYTHAEGWSLEEGIVKTGSFGIDQGFGIRAVSGEKSAFAYSDDISMASILEAAQTVRTIAAAGKSHAQGLKKTTLNKAKAKTAAPLYIAQDPLATQNSAQKVALLERLERMARALDPRVTQVMADLSCEYDVVLLARLDGLQSADVRPLVRLSVTAIAEQTVKGNTLREVGSSGGGGRYGLNYFDDALLMQYAKEAVHMALTNLEARPAPAGQMSVVLGSGWPGVLLHEAVGHGLEGDFNRKGSSIYSGKMGKRVAAKGVTVIDDGTLQDRRGSLNVDDEGHATQRNVLIEDGILTGYLQDRMNARLMNSAVTGNGRRESYAHLPMPRMTNTFMTAGHQDPAEIIASLDTGIYATNFGGGQVDITNGKFVFSASLAYWVEGGKIQYPIKGATLIGNGPEALKHVTHIGNDMALDSGIGVCGKEGQSVPVGVGQPTLRIEGLTVGGTA